LSSLVVGPSSAYSISTAARLSSSEPARGRERQSGRSTPLTPLVRASHHIPAQPEDRPCDSRQHPSSAARPELGEARWIRLFDIGYPGPPGVPSLDACVPSSASRPA
jgi:hypothetical protein